MVNEENNAPIIYASEASSFVCHVYRYMHMRKGQNKQRKKERIK